MHYRDFRVNTALRILFISALNFLIFYLLNNTRLITLILFLAGFSIYQIFRLIHYVQKTNRELSRFLDAIKYDDISQSFSKAGLGSSFDTLNNAFSDVIQEIGKAKAATEEHFLYLQTVVQHVGSGLISFQPNGEVELINRTAKQLLGINQLKNVRSLESISKPLVDTLLGMHSGDRALVEMEMKDSVQQLALNATEFKMRNQNFTLVTLQNITSELERERMSKELEIAHQVQMSLLPKSSPRVPGYDISGLCIPAKEVGGDYFDFIELANGKMGIALGDVSGKGVPAAIYMTLVKGVLQSQADDRVTPKEVLTKVNNLMYQMIERKTFVSLFYALLDTKKRILTCGRAGHNPPIVFKASGSHSWIEPPGIALGLEKGKVFKRVIAEKEIRLNKGDTLVFYTDGFTEASNVRQEIYGEDRLISAIAKNRKKKARELIQAICEDVQQFSENQPQHDDMTIITIQVL